MQPNRFPNYGTPVHPLNNFPKTYRRYMQEPSSMQPQLIPQPMLPYPSYNLGMNHHMGIGYPTNPQFNQQPAYNHPVPMMEGTFGGGHQLGLPISSTATATQEEMDISPSISPVGDNRTDRSQRSSIVPPCSSPAGAASSNASPEPGPSQPQTAKKRRAPKQQGGYTRDEALLIIYTNILLHNPFQYKEHLRGAHWNKVAQGCNSAGVNVNMDTERGVPAYFRQLLVRETQAFRTKFPKYKKSGVVPPKMQECEKLLAEIIELQENGPQDKTTNTHKKEGEDYRNEVLNNNATLQAKGDTLGMTTGNRNKDVQVVQDKKRKAQETPKTVIERANIPIPRIGQTPVQLDDSDSDCVSEPAPGTSSPSTSSSTETPKQKRTRAVAKRFLEDSPTGPSTSKPKGQPNDLVGLLTSMNQTMEKEIENDKNEREKDRAFEKEERQKDRELELEKLKLILSYRGAGAPEQ